MKENEKSSHRHWPMTFESSIEDGVLVVAPKGRIGYASAGAFQRAVEERIHQGSRQVVIDLEGVDYVSGAGLVALDALSRGLHSVGGRMVICAPGEPVTLVLKLAGWDARFAIESSRTDAVSRLTR